MNSGTINSVANSAVVATLILPVPGALNSLSHSSSVVLDTIVPTPISASVAADGVRIDVFLSEPLTPASLAALESDEFMLGSGTSATVQDIIVTSTNTQVLELVLAVPSYNPDDIYDPNDPVDPADPKILPGETVTLTWTNDADTITDAAGNSLSNITALSVTNEIMPVVQFVALPLFSQGVYKAGDTVSIEVNFSSSVTVTGIPQLMLDVGGSEEVALYAAGSPGAVLTFDYIVEAGQNDDSLAYSSANALILNGGNIQSTSDSTLAADLILPEPGEFGSLSGNFFPVVIDTIAPAAPSIDPIAGDYRISVAERNANDGVEITGTQAADVFTVTLCVGATDATDPLCEGGRTYEAALPVAATFAPTWGYDLDDFEITLIGEGNVTLTAIASDAAGNLSVSSPRTISVDAFVPPSIVTVSDDNFINEIDNGRDKVTILGTHDAAATISLCVGGIPIPYDPTVGLDPFCEGGEIFVVDGIEKVTGVVSPSLTAGNWEYQLNTADITASGEGIVTLTAIATDAVGNITVSPSHDVTVDLIKPTPVSAGINAGSMSITVNVSEPLKLISDVDSSAFTLAGDDAEVTAVSTAGTTLTLTLDMAITAGSVTLELDAIFGEITDTAGNSMADFTGQALTPAPTDVTPPATPVITTPIDDDNIIIGYSGYSSEVFTYSADAVVRSTFYPDASTASPGVYTFFNPIYTSFTVEGTREDENSIMSLCIRATDATDPTCAGGSKIEQNGLSSNIEEDPTINAGTTFATFTSTETTWSFTLNDIAVRELVRFGPVTLTAIATDDPAGNTAVSESVVITVISPLADPTLTDPAPTAVSAVANGTSIAVTLSEPVTLTDTLDGSEFTLSGTSASVNAVSPSGLTLILSLDSAIPAGERVTLAYTAGAGDIIADVNANAMSDFTNLLVSTSTTVVVEVTAVDRGDSVPITVTFADSTTVVVDGPAAARVYNSGDSVPITVTFSDVVTVTGTPQLALNTGGASNGIASYTGGSGTASLTFTYLVRADDNAGDLAYTGIDALSGDIQGTTSINLTLPTPGDANSLSGSSNVVLDNTAPDNTAPDNTAPAAPTFDAVGDLEGAPTGRSNRLNAAALTTRLLPSGVSFSEGVPWGGSVEAGVAVTLCLAGAGDGTGASCGTVPGRTLRATTTVGTRWIYTLTLVDLAAMGEGTETVTAFATDAAGNVSDEASYVLIIDTTAPVFISGDSGAVAVNSATTVIAYDANARDNGGVADDDITYTLVATTSLLPVLTYTADELATLSFIANELAIDSATGEVTYRAVQSAAAAQNIVITATDLAGNTATQAVELSVLDGTITLTITDDVTTESVHLDLADRVTTANIASGDVTFSFIFSEDVTGFDMGDITVAEGTKGAFTGTDPGRSYTLVVTPTADTDSGTITVTVDAGLATSQAMSSVTNVETIATLEYDTVAPAVPVIVAPLTDDTINIANRDAGVIVSGTTESEAGITLCAGATDATDPTCAGGTTFPVRVYGKSGNTTEWDYTLTADDISAIGNRTVTLTAIATDVGGNTAVSAEISITVDIASPAPAIDDPVAGDNFINMVEHEAGVPITGTHNTALTVTLCAGATDVTDPICAGGTTYDTTVTDTTWSFTLTEAHFGDTTGLIDEGVVTLTAIATDEAGNTAVSPGHDITVDTILPTARLSFTGGIESVDGTSVVLSGTVSHDALLPPPDRRVGLDNKLPLQITPAPYSLPKSLVVNIYDGDDENYMGGQAELLGQAEVADDRHSWSFTDTTLAAGDVLMYTAVIADAAGNESILRDSTVFTTRTTDDVGGTETIGLIELTPTTRTVEEGSTTNTYTVALDTEPSGRVTVSIEQEDEVTTNPVTLTFTTTNWGTPRTVTLTAEEDDDATTDVTRLTHTASGGGYEGVTATLTVTVTDNDNENALTTRLNEQILTRASQAMTASTLEAVAKRVEAVAGSAGGTGTTPALAYQFGGQSSLSGLLKSHGKAMLEDNMEYEQLFDGASFVVPLSATESGTGGGKPGAGTLSLWGSSDFINLGSDNDELDWDGQAVSINVGVDKLVGEKMLAGFALSSNQSSFDYVDSEIDDAEGEYNYSNTILHPYIGWFPGEDLKLWASVGFGSGEIEIDTKENVYSTDTSQQSLSGGFSRRLLNSTKQTSGNTTTLNLKGDVSMTSVDVEENLADSFVAQKVGSTRLRVLVSGEQQRGLASGGRLTPSLEMGVRNDGGDGVTGTGVELGGGLRYANSGGNVTVSGNVRTLLAGEYDEFGVDFLLQLSPQSGRGLSLSLHPVWGQTQSATEQLWDADINEIGGGDTALQSSLYTEVGYGVAASMMGTSGVLTPYTGLTTENGETNRVRLGTRFSASDGLSVNLEGVRNNTVDSASHSVLLRGTVEF